MLSEVLDERAEFLDGHPRTKFRLGLKLSLPIKQNNFVLSVRTFIEVLEETEEKTAQLPIEA